MLFLSIGFFLIEFFVTRQIREFVFRRVHVALIVIINLLPVVNMVFFVGYMAVIIVLKITKRISFKNDSWMKSVD